MNIPVSELAQHGLIKDTPAIRLPLGAFTDCLNVDFREGYVTTRPRTLPVLTPSIAPLSLVPATADDVGVWAIAGKAAVYGYDGSTQADITRVAGAYTAANFGWWQGCMFNSFLILNNGVDAPQAWGPVAVGTKLVDLTAWPANTTAKVVVGYKSSLVALNVTKVAGADPKMVKWSHTADPMTLPATWDETDPTYEAGEVSLNDAQDGLVDGVLLGDSLALYTRTGVWLMRRVGGSDIFDISKRPFAFGALCNGVVTTFPGGHFVVTPDDFVVHDGTTAKSVATGSVKRYFRSNLLADTYFLARAVTLFRERQIWIFYPHSSGELDEALVWNWETNTWTHHELTPIRTVAVSPFAINYAFDPWTGEELVQWDDESSEAWGTTATMQTEETMLVSPFSTAGINLVADDGTESLETTLTRQDIIHVDGNKANTLTYKRLIALRPLFDAPAGTVFTISVGGRDDISASVSWDTGQTFTVGTDVEVKPDVTYRFLAYKIETTGTAAWKLVMLTLEIMDLGEAM